MGRIPFILLILGMVSCQQEEAADFIRERGQVASFAEMVAAGVKPLALSPPMPSDQMDAFEQLARDEANQFGVAVFREKDLLETDLFADSLLDGQEVLLICDTLIKLAYDSLKADRQHLIDQNTYVGSDRRQIARRFGRLLGYSPQGINELLADQTEFRTLADFGVEATNLFWYYRDREAALDFYTGILGLSRVAEYDHATILQLATDSYLTLVDDGTGMHSADEPKSVALALLTDQLSDWWSYLEDQSVNVRYSFTPRQGGPHDGFVIVDPEGYLLEFETFKQHLENEALMPRLASTREMFVQPGSDNAPEGLAFNGTVAWLYYQDVLAMEGFMEQTMGFPLVVDQGWAKVYAASNSGFIGLVDERRGMCDYTDEKAVNVSYWIRDLEDWWAYAKKQEPFPLRSDSLSRGPDNRFRAFVGYDPEGYFLEFNSFLVDGN